MPKHIVLALCILTASTTLPAKEDSAALADRFVALMRYEDLYAKYQQQCVATQRSISPEALVERSPNYFGGIKPGTSKWSAVVAIYSKYYQQACARPTKEEFVNALSTSYAKSLTAKQLREAIAFYSSESGAALISAHATATAALYDTWTSINSRYLADLTAKVQQDIQVLSASK